MFPTLFPLLFRPSAGLLRISSRIDAETGEILKKQSLPPDEVVEYTIQARQLSQWNKFFLYLNVENLMLEDPDAKRRYNRSPEADRTENGGRFS